jgi:putative ferrous iron transport protein C
MLINIKNYLQKKQTANLQEIAWHCQQSLEITRDMLQIWLRKGKVKICPKPVGCGSKCQQCQPEFAEVYEWADK